MKMVEWEEWDLFSAYQNLGLKILLKSVKVDFRSSLKLSSLKNTAQQANDGSLSDEAIFHFWFIISL